MTGHHGNIRSPFLFQPNEYPHADTMHTGLTHTVEAIDTPFKIRLHSTWMIKIVIGPVVRFLKTNDAVHTMMAQFRILFRRERHNLYFQIGKIRLCQIQRTGDVGNTSLNRIFTCDDEQIFKRRQTFDSTVFVNDFLFCENDPFHFVGYMKATIYARVGAGIGYVERYKHRNGTSETLLCIASAEAGHCF